MAMSLAIMPKKSNKDIKNLSLLYKKQCCFKEITKLPVLHIVFQSSPPVKKKGEKGKFAANLIARHAKLGRFPCDSQAGQGICLGIAIVLQQLSRLSPHFVHFFFM